MFLPLHQSFFSSNTFILKVPFASTFTSFRFMFLRLRFYVYVFTFLRLRFYVYVFTFTFLRLRFYVYVFTFTFLRLRFYVYVFTFTFLRLRFYVYVFTFTFAFTFTFFFTGRGSPSNPQTSSSPIPPPPPSSPPEPPPPLRMTTSQSAGGPTLLHSLTAIPLLGCAKWPSEAAAVMLDSSRCRGGPSTGGPSILIRSSSLSTFSPRAAWAATSSDMRSTRSFMQSFTSSPLEVYCVDLKHKKEN